MSAPAVLENNPRGFITVTQLIPNGQHGAGAGAGIPAGGVHIVRLNTVGAPVVTQRSNINTETSTSARFEMFLKVQPTALGAIQIIVGLVSFAFGVITTLNPIFSGTVAGILLVGSLLYIVVGCLSIAAVNTHCSRLMLICQRLNVASAVIASIAVIFIPMEFRSFTDYPPCNFPPYSEKCEAYRRFRNQVNGVHGVLLVFSVLQLIISICITTCTCCTKPTAPAASAASAPPSYTSCYTMSNSLQTHNGQQNVYYTANPSNNVNNPPMEDPPAYS
ncbi:membrane-spanning 4-domains subfamily A member 4D [Astyanax mexicanus]|uniref:membrane-spanning 4-domains subfamily A member 4D n=1 Tax=Astyanax mexicanus TaxID=7994 RepID=UPI0020CB55EA|nr:membrane-spanning 4-domains subfamily A member 4D [Astyanax mexicanus]